MHKYHKALACLAIMHKRMGNVIKKVLDSAVIFANIEKYIYIFDKRREQPLEEILDETRQAEERWTTLLKEQPQQYVYEATKAQKQVGETQFPLILLQNLNKVAKWS